MLDKLSSISKFLKRRLAIGKPSLFSLPEKPLKNWRVKHYSVQLSRHRTVIITARRFRSSKNHRSKQYKQFVIPFYALPIKELAIRQKLVRPKSKSYTITIVVKPKVLGSYLFVLLGLSGIVYFGLQVKNVNGLEPAQTFAITTPTPVTEYSEPVTMPRSEPTRIHIPAMNLDTNITTVGRLANGTIETPKAFDYVTGWYKYSPTPGELGPAIIVGHVDTYNGISVFWRLHELKPDDIIEITRTDGSVATFKVTALQQFDQANFPTQDVYGDIDYAGLRLITCSGVYDRQTKHYTANTVVFATLITK